MIGDSICFKRSPVLGFAIRPQIIIISTHFYIHNSLYNEPNIPPLPMLFDTEAVKQEQLIDSSSFLD